MRILGIETSTSQAAVALLERGQLVVCRADARPQRSAERLLPLIVEALAEAGWQKGSLDRLGVSVGPGSFTGLRVGIACALGLSLGLDRPLLGVTSLQAMARAVPDSVPGARCALLDARRNEVFAAAYQANRELLAPLALAHETARESIERELPGPIVWIGAGVRLLGFEPSWSSPEAEAPSAHCVGLLAAELEPATSPPLPVYVRDAGATLPPPREA